MKNKTRNIINFMENKIENVINFMENKIENVINTSNVEEQRTKELEKANEKVNHEQKM